MVSVLVPVYNVEKYIDRCLDSITQQTYKQLEIIIVWQPSNDQSKEKIDQWMKRDSRIRLIQQDHADLATARNNLISNAQGEYIIFVDSDDFIELDYIEKLLFVIEKEKADIVVSGCNAFKDEKSIKKQKCPDTWETYTGRDYEYKSMLGKFGTTSGVSQLKLYKKSVFNNIKFPEDRLCEDTATIYKAIWNAERIVTLTYNAYYYQSSRNDSIMHSLKSKERVLIDSLIAKKEQVYFFENKDEQIYALACFNVLTELMRIKAQKNVSYKEITAEVTNSKLLRGVMKGRIPFNRKIVAFGCVFTPHIMYVVWKAKRSYLYKKEWRNKG